MAQRGDKLERLMASQRKCLARPSPPDRRANLYPFLQRKEVPFPLDSESQVLLRTLVANKSFEPDCLCVDARPSRRSDEKNEERRLNTHTGALGWPISTSNMKTPGFLEKWRERRSGAHYAMMHDGDAGGRTYRRRLIEERS